MGTEPRILQISEMKYVGLAIEHNVHETAKGSPVIPQLWAALDTRMAEVKDETGNLFGVAGPVKSDGTAKYAAALEVSAQTRVPPGMIAGVIPAGKYAEFIHHGPISRFSETVRFIHDSWMPKAGYTNHNCSQIEIMSKEADVNSATFTMKVLVPLF